MYLSEDRVQNAIIPKLNKMGYRVVSLKSKGDKGPDVIAEHNKYARRFIIEVKGDSRAKSERSGREVRFLQSLGQLVTRIHPRRGYYYGLAYPNSFKNIALRRVSPDLLKLLHIHLFFVNESLQVELFKWEDVKLVQQEQKMKSKE